MPAHSDRVSEAITIYEAAVNKAIALYETTVKQDIAKLKADFFLDIGNISAIIILLVIASIWSDVAGRVAAWGLGGLNVAAKVSDWNNTIKAYLSDRHKLDKAYVSDRHKLELTVTKVRFEFKDCDPTDNQCLTKVESLIREYLEALERAAEER